VRRVEREPEVLHHRVALVAAGGVQHRRPEVLQQREVIRPVVDDGVEDGADLVVLANAGVEAVNELGDFLLADELLRVLLHGAVALLYDWTPRERHALQ